MSRTVREHILICRYVAHMTEDMKVIVDETLNILIAGRDTVCSLPSKFSSNIH